jgi:hypothetical protein
LKCGVVHEHIELPELLDRSGDSLFAKLLALDVAGDQQTFSAFKLYFLFCEPSVIMFVQIGERDVGTFPREEYGNSAPNSGIAAGDQRDFVR